MPLEPELLELESELRSMKPVELDFPTGQRLVAVMDVPTPALVALPGGESIVARPASAFSSSARWRRALPWSAAAAVAVVGVLVVDRPPAERSIGKGSVEMVFPASPSVVAFGPPGNDRSPTVSLASETRLKSGIVLPEARSPYGHLNLNCFDLPPDYCQRLGISSGVSISWMGEGGPAATHGLEVGDIILKVDGTAVRSAEELGRTIKALSPGTVVTLTVLRGRMLGQIQVRLTSAPSA